MNMTEHSKPAIGNQEVEIVPDIMRAGLLFESDVVKKFEWGNDHLSALAKISGKEIQ